MEVTEGEGAEAQGITLEQFQKLLDESTERFMTNLIKADDTPPKAHVGRLL